MIGHRLVRPRLRLGLLLLVLLLASPGASAAQALIAVATNFTAPAKEIAAAFAATSGHQAVLSFGSTGKLYAQIVHGAPYQALLAADAERPRLLEEQGLALAGSRFTYARGRIVLFSMDAGLLDAGASILSQPTGLGKLAIANPKTAPYGVAALQTMQALGVYQALRGQIVQGENIAQTYQFVYSGNASLGFVALSQLTNSARGSRWLVPEQLYSPIHQDAALLARGKHNTAAIEFLRFLRSDNARAILQRYGYGLD